MKVEDSIIEETEEKLGKVINIPLTDVQRARMRRLIAEMRRKDIPVQGIRAKIGSRGITLALGYYEKLLGNIPEEMEEETA